MSYSRFEGALSSTIGVDQQAAWALVPDWVIHYHTDQTCTAYNPFSGVVLAMSEASGWVLQQLTRSPLSTLNLRNLLMDETANGFDPEMSTFLEATLTALCEDARVVALVAGE